DAKNLDITFVRHFLDIGAGGKGLVRPGGEDAPHICIAVESLDRVEKLVHQGEVECVQGVRAIKLDDPDAASPFDDNGLGAHGYPSRSFHAMLSWRLARGKWRLIPLRADACVSARERRTGG